MSNYILVLGSGKIHNGKKPCYPCRNAKECNKKYFDTYLNANKFESFEKRIESINNFFDAVGLATFSTIGTEMACESGFSDMAVFSISMGLLTGIGGGIIRDILVDSTPYVLKKHIYALASLIGSTIYYFIRINGNRIVALIIAMPIIVIIRILAAKFHWKLPKINL